MELYFLAVLTLLLLVASLAGEFHSSRAQLITLRQGDFSIYAFERAGFLLHLTRRSKLSKFCFPSLANESPHRVDFLDCFVES